MSSLRRNFTPMFILFVTGCSVLSPGPEQDDALFPDVLTEEQVLGVEDEFTIAGSTSSDPSIPSIAPFSGPYPGNEDFDMGDLVDHFTDIPFVFPVKIDEVGPIDHSLGVPQQPFSCKTEESGFGQPIVDNQDSLGIPVYVENSGKKTDVILGYSKHCLMTTRAGYFYKPIGEDVLLPLPDPLFIPDNIDTMDFNGTDTMFIVRKEHGTINRFIYTIAVPADPTKPIDEPSGEFWNKKLLYFFVGGISAGKEQGAYSFKMSMRERLNSLKNGYAVVYSTGNHTANHYNMWVAQNTAQMVYAQFESLYGEPEHTIGVGASGGALQQYLLAETKPDFLDALIPVYSFPDVETEALWVPDCELLEYYFDVTAVDNARWEDYEQRSMIVGFASDPDKINKANLMDNVFRFFTARPLRPKRGANSCTEGWRTGLIQLDNPRSTNKKHHFSEEVFNKIDWSHNDDLRRIVGVAGTGYAHRFFDNVGVQYGLKALKRGEISMPEFLHLNANIGGMRPPEEQTEARLWFFQDNPDPNLVSLWNEQNFTNHDHTPIPIDTFSPFATINFDIADRTVGIVEVMQALYLSGHVFRGKVNLDLPILDVRHYTDKQSDIHHSFASLSIRQRILDHQEALGNTGDYGNMRIWVAEYPNEPEGLFDDIDNLELENAERRHRTQKLIDQAVDAMSDWLTNGTDPEDACWTKEMSLINRGTTVWDGPWNGESPGTCTQHFPHYESPRNAAGAPLRGDMFKCDKYETIQAAIMAGVYAPLDVTPYEQALEQVFPQGVCNYDAGDTANPF